MGSPTTESPRQRNAEAYFERPTGGFSYWIQWWIGGNHPVITRVGQCTGIQLYGGVENHIELDIPNYSVKPNIEINEISNIRSNIEIRYLNTCTVHARF